MPGDLALYVGLNAGGLESLRALDDLEFDGLAFLEIAVAIPLNRTEVNEDVVTVLARDESVTLFRAEPLYGSLGPGQLQLTPFRCFVVTFFRRNCSIDKAVLAVPPGRKHIKVKIRRRLQVCALFGLSGSYDAGTMSWRGNECE